jgi:hypothetical protein
VDKFEARYSFIDNEDELFLIKTNKDAPMFKLIVANVADGTHAIERVSSAIRPANQFEYAGEDSD